MIIEQADIDALTICIPDGKRVPFGWSAFALSSVSGAHPAILSWPHSSLHGAPKRLRITVALDTRENIQVEARNARTGEMLGTFDIRYPSALQPFEIPVASAHAALAAHDGVRLQMVRGEEPLWLFDGGNGAPDTLAPHWIGALEGDHWARFDKRLCSVSSIQPFGWIEGCVLDGLWQMARLTGHQSARDTLSAHLRLFISPSGSLNYEGPRSTPFYDMVYGMECLLPFALIAQTEPDNPMLDLAVDYCLAHRDQNGSVLDCETSTTEGAYVAGYPLAVIGKARGRDDLKQMAYAQLRSRQTINIVNGTIFQAVSADGRGHLPNWARGAAWYLLGFARVLEILHPGAEAADCYAEYQRAALWVMDFQQDNGLWRNFFDDPQSAADTSGSAGIAAALAAGARCGLLPPSARKAAQRCMKGLEPFLAPDSLLGGMAQFNKGGEGLQRDNYRVMAPMAMGLAAQLRAEILAVMF